MRKSWDGVASQLAAAGINTLTARYAADMAKAAANGMTKIAGRH